MAQAVKISDPEMNALRDAARLNSRSISGQAEHWMRIGRAVERDPAIGYSNVERALRGLDPLDLDTLADADQEAFFENLAAEPPTTAEDAHWRDRRRRGLGVGLNDQDQMVAAAGAGEKKKATARR